VLPTWVAKPVSPQLRVGLRVCERVVRGGVEPPTFRFSGVTDVQASDVAAAWTVAEVRRRSGSVAVVAVTVAVGSKLCEPPGTARDDGFTDGYRCHLSMRRNLG
jgi:hypothetical protein